MGRAGYVRQKSMNASSSGSVLNTESHVEHIGASDMHLIPAKHGQINPVRGPVAKIHTTSVCVVISVSLFVVVVVSLAS